MLLSPHKLGLTPKIQFLGVTPSCCLLAHAECKQQLVVAISACWKYQYLLRYCGYYAAMECTDVHEEQPSRNSAPSNGTTAVTAGAIHGNGQGKWDEQLGWAMEQLGSKRGHEQGSGSKLGTAQLGSQRGHGQGEKPIMGTKLAIMGQSQGGQGQGLGFMGQGLRFGIGATSREARVWAGTHGARAMAMEEPDKGPPVPTKGTSSKRG